MSARLLARMTTVVVGVWLMFSSAVLEYSGTVAADNDRIVGPIAGAFAFVACWAVLDPLRWPTLPLGAWLVVAPLVLGDDSGAAVVSSIVSGAIIVGVAFVGEDLRDRFGGGWSSVFPSRWRRDDSRGTTA